MAENTGQPLKGGYLPPVPPNASSDVQIAAMNDIINRLNSQLQTTVLSDGQNKRYLNGYQKDGWGTGHDFGMKISISGVDVTVATDAQLLFWWDFTTGTQKWYDPSTGKNYMIQGVLPDGTGGFAVAKAGNNVSEGFT